MAPHPPPSPPTTLNPPGELAEYVVAELNAQQLEVCADPLRYANLRGEPDWQVGLGRG